MRATVFEMMIFVRATVLEATVFEMMIFVRATVLEATVPMEIYGIIGATVLEATVVVGATVLGSRPRECG
jgi:hypothetical protein